eukprot:TRINITY_DN5086_c1_g1_i1.p1 TRINITY_DN5086_c1_g1~~TRINITY_DN5086_c1_g1_i1.p1  ORF type:complete len:2992 (+),score=590.07 TRINITY_DN5086_c1_g1_i1:220-9195(+)
MIAMKTSLISSVASLSIPSLLVMLLDRVNLNATVGSQNTDQVTRICDSLYLMCGYQSCVDDLIRGGCNLILLQIILRSDHSDATCEMLLPKLSDLLIKCSTGEGNQQSLAQCGPIQLAIKSLTEDGSTLTTYHHLRCLLSVCQILSKSEASLKTSPVQELNTNITTLVESVIRSAAQHDEAIHVYCDLGYIDPKMRKTKDQEQDHLVIKNSLIFAKLPEIAAQVPGSSQQAVCECVIKALMGNNINYDILTEDTPLLPALLMKLESYELTGQVSVIQLIQFCVQQLDRKPSDTIRAAVASTNSNRLPFRVVWSMYKMFHQFIMLDASYQQLLHDFGIEAAIINTIHAIHKFPFDTNKERGPTEDAQLCIDSACSTAIALSSGSVSLSHQCITSLATGDNIQHLIETFSSDLLQPYIKKMIFSVLKLDAPSHDPSGFLEGVLLYISNASRNVGVNWSHVAQCMLLIHKLLIDPEIRSNIALSKRIQCCGGVQLALSLLRPLSGIGKTESELDPPPTSPILSRITWALVSAICSRHTPEMSGFSSASKALKAAYHNPLPAFYDFILASTGHWLSVSSHNELLTELSDFESGSATSITLLKPDFSFHRHRHVLFPAALSGAIAILPSLEEADFSEAIHCLVTITKERNVPMLIPGDVWSANAIIELCEKEWFTDNQDHDRDDTSTTKYTILHNVLPDAMASWHQSSHLKKLTEFMNHPPGPVNWLEKAADCLIALKRDDIKQSRTNHMSFTGGCSNVLLNIKSGEGPLGSNAGFSVSVWFRYFPAVASCNGTSKAGPILFRAKRDRFFYQFGISNDGVLFLLSNSLDVSDAVGDPHPQFFTDYNFEEGVWYSVVLTHQKTSKLSLTKHSSEISLFVNGIQRQKLGVGYPHVVQLASDIELSCGWGIPRGTDPYSGPFSIDGRFDVANMRVVSSVLSPHSVQVIHLLGPSYLGDYRSSDIGDVREFQRDILTKDTMSELGLRLLSSERVQWPAEDWPVSTSDNSIRQHSNTFCFLFPSSGSDQGAPVVCLCNGVTMRELQYFGNVTNAVWTAPGGTLATTALQRGGLHLLLGWACEGQQLSLGRPTHQAVAKCIAGAAALIVSAGPYDSLLASDGSLFCAIAGLIKKYPQVLTKDPTLLSTLSDVAVTKCGIVRSLPMLRHVLLDPTISAMPHGDVILVRLRSLLSHSRLRAIAASRLQNGMDVVKPLLVIVSSSKMPISTVKTAILVLTDMINLLAVGPSGVIEAVIGDLFDCIEHLLSAKTTVTTYRAVLLLRVVLGAVDLFPNFCSKHRPHTQQMSQALQQHFASLSNLLSIVKKKIPLSSVCSLLEKEQHPISTVLLLQLLQFLVGSSSKKIEPATSRAIATAISNHCNQPEVHGVLLTILMGNGRADLERPEFQPGPNDDLTGLQKDLLPVLLQFLTRGYQTPDHSTLSQPISMTAYLDGDNRRSCERWVRVLSRVRMLVTLRKHFGLPAPPVPEKEKINSSFGRKTPPPGGLFLISQELHLAGKQLCEASLRSIKGCLQYPKWVQVFQKDDISVYLTVDLSFGVLGKSGGINDEGLPTMVSMLSDDMINDFVLVGDRAEASDQSDIDDEDDDVIYTHDDEIIDNVVGTTHPTSATDKREGDEKQYASDGSDSDGGLPPSPSPQLATWGESSELMEKSTAVQMAASALRLLCRERDLSPEIIPYSGRRSRRNQNFVEKRSVATLMLHKLLNWGGARDITDIGMYQIALVNAFIQGAHSDINDIIRCQSYFQNMTDILNYIVTRMYSGKPTPVFKILSFVTDLIDAFNTQQQLSSSVCRVIWTGVVNRIALWLITPRMQPADFNYEEGVNAMLCSLSAIMHQLNCNDAGFLKRFLFLLFEVQTTASTPTVVNDKVLLILRLLIDTYKVNAPAVLSEVFAADDKKRKLNILEGYSNLDGTTASTCKFKVWFSDHEKELREFFHGAHLAAYQQLRRREDRMAQWLKQITQPSLFRFQQVTAALSLLCSPPSGVTSKESPKAKEDDAVMMTCVEPQLLEPSTSDGVMLRCGSLLSQSPSLLFGTSNTSPIRVVGSRLGPWMPTTELSPTKASAVSTSEDSLIPLRWKVCPSNSPDWSFASYRSIDWITSLIVPKSDTVQEIFNCSRISYLESIPTVLIVGHESLYFVTHCRVTEGNALEYLPAKSKGGQQHTNEQKPLSPSNTKNSNIMGSLTGGGFGLTSIVSQGLRGLRYVVSSKSKTGDEQKSLLSMTLIHLLEEAHYYSIPLSAITEVVKRRTHHEPAALEVSLENRRGLLLTILDKAGVMNENLRNKVHRMLTSCCSYVRNSESSATIGDLTHLWKNRLLSNFDYLLAVNSCSGRTFLDLNQYPVFPWIISDYTSSQIRLSDESIYRDLSKPMAGLDEKRSSSFARRYSEWNPDDCAGVPKFHCGSHYSTPMMVLWYLTRLQPYTSMAVIYQGGKLDLADRLFHSIADAWHSASQGSNTDVKELIPELFYSPEYLRNHNNLNLGTNRDGELLGDVVLPPWANSPEHFIATQREALESEYVSNNINEWLDLIWGFAQSGEEAAKRLNVFFYLAYPGGLKKAIKNDVGADEPSAKWAAATQVAQFGQTPRKLWQARHPKRGPKTSIIPFQKVEQLCSNATNSIEKSACVIGADSGYPKGGFIHFLSETSPLDNFPYRVVFHPSQDCCLLGLSQGYAELKNGLGGQSGGFLRVFNSDGTLNNIFRVPCSSIGSCIASMPCSGIIFIGTKNGILACKLNHPPHRNVNENAQQQAGLTCWTASSPAPYSSLTARYRMLSHWGAVSQLMYVEGSSLLISSSSDGGHPVVWSVGLNKGTFCGTLKDHVGAVVDAKVIPSRRWLVTVSHDTLYIFNTTDLSLAGKVKSTSDGALSSVSPIESPDREIVVPLLTGHSSGKICLWVISLNESGAILTIKNHTFLPGSKSLPPVVSLTSKPPPYVVYPTGSYYSSSPSEIAYSTDKEKRKKELSIFLYSGHYDGSVRQWCGPTLFDIDAK